MISILGFKPSELGLPPKFEEFRPAQIEAADHVLGSDYRFDAMALPLGSGKSLIAMALAKASDARTVILTATKGLMSQYRSEFDIFEIKGRENYRCEYHSSCRYGSLEGCPMLGNGCLYELCRDGARDAPILVTNYQYWLHINEHPPGLGDIQQLILDEAHQAPAELSKYLQTEVREPWLKHANMPLPKEHETSISSWRTFAFNQIVFLTRQIQDGVKQVKQAVANHNPKVAAMRDRIRELDQLLRALENISTMDADTWVLEYTPGKPYGRQWLFDNIWPGAHSFKLFRNVPKVVAMSGTLRPSVMADLGVPKDKYEFRDWPRVFPAHHTPVYFIPTLSMNKDTDDAGMQRWVERIDEIIGSRLDRKGIIHTVSYERQRYLRDHSQYARYMVANTSDPDSPSAGEIVQGFKSATAPRILVSPSFSTGWDFPGRSCEWQIIAKIPYPDLRSKIVKARNAHRRSYSAQIAMQSLEQACGRGSRSYLDRCEIFIIDNVILSLLYHHPGLKSRWFSYIELGKLPEPGPRSPE